MANVSKETKSVLDGIMTEIGVGKSFGSEVEAQVWNNAHDRLQAQIDQIQRDREAQVWNNAHDRCLSIIRNYRDGCGLFQIVPKKQAKNAS